MQDNSLEIGGNEDTGPFSFAFGKEGSFHVAFGIALVVATLYPVFLWYYHTSPVILLWY